MKQVQARTITILGKIILLKDTEQRNYSEKIEESSKNIMFEEAQKCPVE